MIRVAYKTEGEATLLEPLLRDHILHSDEYTEYRTHVRAVHECRRAIEQHDRYEVLWVERERVLAGLSLVDDADFHYGRIATVHVQYVPEELAGVGFKLMRTALRIAKQDGHRVLAYAKDSKATVVEATAEDWETEYLSYDIAAAVVDSLDRAVEHIRLWTSGHTEAIVTTSQQAARCFTKLVDSTTVAVNASTRFTDGGQFGFGAEIGISTQKLHARGPMGLPELTSTKYIVTGDGHVRR